MVFIHSICQNSNLLFVSMFEKREGNFMIEIENEKNRNLQNVKQIGTPREENKIYIENTAYNRMSEENYHEKKVFVLMGHTEHMEGRYATFVEAVIPVREIEFRGTIPMWTNHTWSEVFREIKRLYEDMIIVGWAIDVKGMSVKMTPELERVHREHFGGVHQLLLLLDTQEHEETFYIYKENKLVFKDGFYIYHKAKRKEYLPVKVVPEKNIQNKRKAPEVDVELELLEPEYKRGGRYRQLMQEPRSGKKDSGNMGIAAAVAMLVFILSVSLYENSGKILQSLESIETNLLQHGQSTEISEEKKENSTEVKDNDAEDSGEYIEIEIVPGRE